jgi:hypothetical protein
MTERLDRIEATLFAVDLRPTRQILADFVCRVELLDCISQRLDEHDSNR